MLIYYIKLGTRSIQHTPDWVSQVATHSTYSYAHLLAITGYKWDDTFYKWGFLVLITGITRALTVDVTKNKQGTKNGMESTEEETSDCLMRFLLSNRHQQQR